MKITVKGLANHCLARFEDTLKPFLSHIAAFISTAGLPKPREDQTTELIRKSRSTPVRDKTSVFILQVKVNEEVDSYNTGVIIDLLFNSYSSLCRGY